MQRHTTTVSVSFYVSMNFCLKINISKCLTDIFFTVAEPTKLQKIAYCDQRSAYCVMRPTLKGNITCRSLPISLLVCLSVQYVLLL